MWKPVAGVITPPPGDADQDFTDLVNAMNTANTAKRLDFMMINGDITDHGGVADEARAAQRLAELDMPLLVLQGNHDRLTDEQWRSVWHAPGNQVLTYGTVSLILANTGDGLTTSLKSMAGDVLNSDRIQW